MNDLELARQEFRTHSYTFVIVRDGKVLTSGTRDGVGELLTVVTEQDEALRGATLADKIVGKAVAMLAAYAGFAAIATPLGSEAARDVCAAYGIEFHAERLVPLIRNKRNDGPCPMERLTMPLSEPADAVVVLGEFVAAMRAQAQANVGAIKTATA